MSRKENSTCQLLLMLNLVSAIIVATSPAKADSLQVRDSIPVADGVVRGGEVEYVIRFNGLIDHAASRIEITQLGHVIQSFPMFLGSAPNVLFASGEAPAPGRYILRWEAKSPVDGTISSGEIPFSVKQ